MNTINEIKIKIRRVWRKITEPFRFAICLFGWAKVLWRNYDFDYWYLMEVIQYKLIKMEKFLRTQAKCDGAEHKANEIKTAIVMIDILRKDEFATKEYEEHDKKWGKSIMSIEHTNDEHCGLIKLTRSGVKTDQDKQKESKEYMEIVYLEEDRRNKYWQQTFCYIASHIRGWWD